MSANVCFINSKDAETMSLTSKDLNIDAKPTQELNFDLICSNLTNAEQEQLTALLHEYQDCFSTSLEKIGKTLLVSAIIETKPLATLRLLLRQRCKNYWTMTSLSILPAIMQALSF